MSALTEFESLISSSEILFVVYYRGHWCPFCNAYLKSLQSLTPSITSSSGTIVAITSQPAEFTALTRKQSGYTGRIIVDVNNEIASALRERKVVDVAVTPTKGYEHGMAQPAVVVFAKGGKVVLERWAIVPGVMNLQGASDRPDLAQIWENAQARLEKKAPVHQSYNKQTAVGLLVSKIFGW